MIGPQILDVVDIDAFGFWEDMAYNHAPLISPDMVHKYMLLRYRRVTESLRGRGVPYVGLDSDGQIHSLIPVWMDAGLNFLIAKGSVVSGMVKCSDDAGAASARWRSGQQFALWPGARSGRSPTLQEPEFSETGGTTSVSSVHVKPS